MLTATPRTLNTLAALVWYGGAMALLLKGRSLLAAAALIKPGDDWLWLAAGAGLVIGSLKARFILAKSCRKNLVRIAALDQPRIWQFFRPGFFLALAVMIGAGATLSRLAHGNYSWLIAVAGLGFSIAVALLLSSGVFWKQRAFMEQKAAPISRPRE